MALCGRSCCSRDQTLAWRTPSGRPSRPLVPSKGAASSSVPSRAVEIGAKWRGAGDHATAHRQVAARSRRSATAHPARARRSHRCSLPVAGGPRSAVTDMTSYRGNRDCVPFKPLDLAIICTRFCFPQAQLVKRMTQPLASIMRGRASACAPTVPECSRAPPSSRGRLEGRRPSRMRTSTRSGAPLARDTAARAPCDIPMTAAPGQAPCVTRTCNVTHDSGPRRGLPLDKSVPLLSRLSA